MTHRSRRFCSRRLWAGFINLALVASLCVAAGCKGAPRGRVLRTEPIAKGAGTVEAERRRLQGTWELVSLETLDAAGAATPLDAAGRMTFDDYGNVKTNGTVKQGPSTAKTLLSYAGRVVIDPDKKEWRLLDMQAAPESAAAPAAVDADKVRGYELVGDQLKLSLRDASGRVTARVTWKRVGA
jgi:hypothetical protein